MTRGVLVFLKFGYYSRELKETGSSGATESEIWIGKFNVKAWKTTEHKLQNIWRSLKFCKNSWKQAHSWVHCFLLCYSRTLYRSRSLSCAVSSAISPSLLTVEHLKENLIHLNGVKTDQKRQRKQQSIVSYTMNNTDKSQVFWRTFRYNMESNQFDGFPYPILRMWSNWNVLDCSLCLACNPNLHVYKLNVQRTSFRYRNHYIDQMSNWWDVNWN